MAFNLFGAPKRRSRSSSDGGGGKALDTIILIGGVGILAFGGYFLLRSGKGVDEALGTGGDFLKDLVDAGNSSGEAIGNASCHIQKLFKPSLNCGAGYRVGSSSGGGSNNKRSEEKDIVGKLKEHFSPIEREIEKNEERSIISREDIGKFFNDLGCGTILRPKC